MMEDELLPWGTLQCAGKLAGHRLLDWSFYALILVFPVIWYFLFGSWFKSQLGSLVSAAKGSYLDIFWNWKNCHNGTQFSPKAFETISQRRFLPKLKVCLSSVSSTNLLAQNSKLEKNASDNTSRALLVALVVRCWHISSNKAPCLVADISEPVRWKWKKKNVGLSSVMSELKLSTLQGFYVVDHDFLRLPQLLKTFCNQDYHVRQIKLALD